ncbi:MAG: DUF2029 domain-containing protein, partial [Acidobacteria bacterium]|nr:DUF2029 domain-containing protein [Acidobacteriota bacterium]
MLFATVFSYYAALRTVDFPVYHYAARAMLEQNQPLYGPDSGIGWPMVYRYPPLFLLLFVPFALLPLKAAAALWAALKFAVLFLLLRELAKRMEGPSGMLAWLFVALLAGRYIVVEFRYGNAQFFVFALVAVSLLWLQTRPKAAASALALAASMKVWPLFFFPYLAARRKWRVLAWALPITIGLTFVPMLYFGWSRHWELLAQWAAQELSIANTPEGVGFPSQSLHGILMRYLTAINYSRMPDPNYPRINLLALDPFVVEFLWLLLAVLFYATLLWLARLRTSAEEWTAHSLAFCGLLLLEPFTHAVHLVVLIWPAMAAASLLTTRSVTFPDWAKRVIYAAVALAAVSSFVPGAESRRFLQVIGADFWLSCLLSAAFIGALVAAKKNRDDAVTVDASAHAFAEASNNSASSARLCTST